MKIVYARQPLDRAELQIGSVFLAGPTPRDKDTVSWRPAAIELFRQANFSGTLLVPEDETGGVQGNYDDQIEWEDEALTLANCIMFWMPRKMNGMPGLTTNDEFGTWKKSGKCVLGAPEDAEKVVYQRYYAKKLNIPSFTVLADTVAAALKMNVRNTIRLLKPINVIYLDEYCKDCGHFLTEGENHHGLCNSEEFRPEPA